MDERNMRLANTAGMSLTDATKPLMVVSRLFGMNPKSHWHKIYTGFTLASYLTIYCFVWWHFSRLSLKKYYFDIIVSAWHDAGRVISLLIILGSDLFHQERFMIPINDFTTIDQSLKNLNGFTDNKGIYRLQILLVIRIGLLPIIIGLTGIRFHLSWFSDSPMFYIIVLGWLHMLAVITIGAVADSTFLSTLSIIRERFKEMNLIIHRIRKHGYYSRVNLVEDSRIHADNGVFRDLRILRKQYHDLWGIANRVNDAYGPHLLVATMISMAMITKNFWEVYASVEDTPDNMPNAVAECSIWVSYYTTRMYFLVKASESTVSEAKATSVVLHELGMEENHGDATRAEIRDFLVQLQMEVRKFSANGFFDIDFSLICSMCAAVCTYLVILIQMGS